MRPGQFFPAHYHDKEVIQVIGQASRPQLGTKFNVLVWNIHKGTGIAWSDDFQALMQGMDLVLLQEAVMNTRHDTIFTRDDNWEWVMARSFKDRRTLFDTGVKTGSQVPASSWYSYTSESSEPFLRTRKMVLATFYPLANSRHELLVLNVHGINFVSLHKYRLQLLQIEKMLRLHAGPVILGGDFNSWSRKRIASILVLTRQCGLTEASMERTARWLHFNRHLDHVFYRGLQLTGIRTQANIRSSDHFPICISFGS